ncbi:MAG: DUF2309 domain-containing protein, partial [Planctomycetota bacterium]
VQNLSTLGQSIEEAVGSIAPVWPLADYVAVNPYQSWSDQRFDKAMAGLHTLSGAENIPSWEQLRQLYDREQVSVEMVATTLRRDEDLRDLLSVKCVDTAAKHLFSRLSSSTATEPDGQGPSPKIRTVGDVLSEWYGRDYQHHVHQQVGRFCESHLDNGFSGWQSPTADQPFFAAWKHASQWNLSNSLCGIRDFRKLVRQLPSQPEAAIAQCLQEIRLPEKYWGVYLLTLTHSLPGWFAYANFLDRQENTALANSSFAIQLLAILASYELILTKSFRFHISWPSRLSAPAAEVVRDTNERLALLSAAERSFQTSLLDKLSDGKRAGESRTFDSKADAETSAQFVFCIDVRSERVRRCLEAVDSGIETMGFAGFFGAPMQLQDIDGEGVVNQLPVLLAPAFSVNEDATNRGIATQPEKKTNTERDKRQRRKSVRNIWKSFSSNAASCFTFVESAGLGYSWRLLQRTFLPLTANPKAQNEEVLPQRATEPSCDSLPLGGLTPDAQVELAKGILNNLGLTKHFAKFVVLVGHESCTENNPLAASLECGACGGHSGEPNARLVAALMNLPHVRSGLRDKGIVVPDSTHFIAGTHNTTRCEVELIQPPELDDSSKADLERLAIKVNTATAIAKQEQSLVGQACCGGSHDGHSEAKPRSSNQSGIDLIRRSQDWSQVRPEWGLAGNAAFVVGPRELTRERDLGTSTFLHSYDASADKTGAVLELIMTAPMVVAHWINMQYYASTVNNQVYGSGSKVTHNVIGNFGILSGNSPDLQTGLPLESLSEGEHLMHLPRRLTATIAAPLDRIDAILNKHDNIAQLISNQWMHLLAIADDRVFRRTPSGSWELERLLPRPSAPEAKLSSANESESAFA